MNNEKINKLSRKYNMIKLAQSTAQITFDAGIVFTIIIIVVNTLRIKQNTIDSMGYVNHLFTGISLSMLFFSGILKIYLKRKKADIMETFLELNYTRRKQQIPELFYFLLVFFIKNGGHDPYINFMAY